MAFLNSDIQAQVRDVFTNLDAPVKLVVFSQGKGGALECQMCQDTRELIEEVASLSPKLSVETFDFVADAAVAAEYGVDKIPAIAVVRTDAPVTSRGVRLYGIPSGYEFSTLIEDIRLVSTGDLGLNAQTLKELDALPGPIDIQVFVTPTCPYCPRAVLLAHRLALASDKVNASMVEATEFPQLANRYQVYGVPRTVVNDVIHVEGAVPEDMLMGKMKVLDDAPALFKLRQRWEANLN